MPPEINRSPIGTVAMRGPMVAEGTIPARGRAQRTSLSQSVGEAGYRYRICLSSGLPALVVDRRPTPGMITIGG